MYLPLYSVTINKGIQWVLEVSFGGDFWLVIREVYCIRQVELCKIKDSEQQFLVLVLSSGVT